jgi:hypothetical protein
MCTCTYRTEDGDTVAAREHLTVVSVTGNVPPRMLSIHTLQAFHNTSASTTLLPSTLKGIKACFFFQQYIQRGNKTIPTGSPRTLDDGKPLMDWFLSMATPEKKKTSCPPHQSRPYKTCPAWATWTRACKRQCASSSSCAWMCWSEPDSSSATLMLVSPVLHYCCLAGGGIRSRTQTTASVAVP